jgi:threonine synthase
MFEKQIICSNCGRSYPADRMIFRCERCSGSLEVIYDYSKLKRVVTKEKLRAREFLHSRYLEMFPVRKLVTLNEGGTALLRSRNIERELKLRFELYFKYEAVNPTGSFKDRGSSVEVAKALEFRVKRVVCASTGNMGASVAAYSAIANVPCYIFIPGDAATTKMKQILAYGAKLYKIPGDYAKAAELVEEAFNTHKAYLLGDYLYRREGSKSVGYEILDQMGFRADGLQIVTPVGNGTLISGVAKACKEFYIMGLINRKPKISGVQSRGCDPVYKAFKSCGKIVPIRHPDIISKAIECGNPLDGERALRAIQDSYGFSESVTDTEILKAREMMARREGLFTEPSGAVPLAGVIKNRHDIPGGSKVVCVVTGHGLKSPTTAVHGREKRISGDPKVLKRVFRE